MLQPQRQPQADREIVGVQGRPVALDIGELFSRYHQKVALWARWLGGPAMEVEDTVQEVFLLAHRRLRRFEREEELRAWLHRVTENVVKERRRRLRREARVAHRDGSQARGVENVPAPEPLPPELVARREAQRRVYSVLDRMSERHRTVFILFEMEELSGQEIADLKGIRLGTIWVWLHRARAEFARCLAELERQD